MEKQIKKEKTNFSAPVINVVMKRQKVNVVRHRKLKNRSSENN